MLPEFDDIKNELVGVRREISLLAHAIENQFAGGQRSFASVKIDNGNKVVLFAAWVAVTTCIVVSALSYQSYQLTSSEVYDLRRKDDRNQDYFNMHKSQIDQLKARLDQLQEPKK